MLWKIVKILDNYFFFPEFILFTVFKEMVMLISGVYKFLGSNRYVIIHTLRFLI
jgi:hypothetical protein